MTITRNAPIRATTQTPPRRARRILFAAVALTIAVIVALALWLWLPSSQTGATLHTGRTAQHVQAGHYDRCAPGPGMRYC